MLVQTHTYAMEFMTNYNDADAVVDLLEKASDACLNSKYRDHSVVCLPARGQLLATGDLHDNPIHLSKIIRLAALDKSPDHHVIAHELIHGENLINGMDFSHRMLFHAAELKARYPDQFHPLLANHELAQFTGASVSKGAGDSVQLFNDAIEWVFNDKAERVTNAINDFLRTWPIALITASGILCAHSLPAESEMNKFDDTLLERDLTDDDFTPRAGSAYYMLWGRRHSAEHLDRLAERFDVRAFILGHQHADVGWRMLSPRTIILNSDHERAAVLPIDLESSPPAPTDWPVHIIPLGAIPE